MLTLQMVEIRVGWGPRNLINKLEIQESSDLAGDFEAFFSFSSFLAGYNWLQQPIKQKQTIFKCCLLFK
jgi:hypothetical protein